MATTDDAPQGVPRTRSGRPLGGRAPAPRAAPPAREPTRWTRGKIPGEPGIWIFILGDMTLYGGLFATFMYDRSTRQGLFDRGSEALRSGFGIANTLILLTSSLFVALAVRAVRERIRPDLAQWLIGGALLCSAAFIVNKGFEYHELIADHLTPSHDTFHLYFFLLTGVHLAHVIAGTAVLLFMRHVAAKPQHGEREVTAIEIGASFWHVVDLLWVVLFALLYLVR